MRMGRNPEVSIVNGKLYGFNLSFDSVAEHEWGIEGLKHKFGIDTAKTPLGRKKKLKGVDRRIITNMSEDLLQFDTVLIDGITYYVLISIKYENGDKVDSQFLKWHDLYPYNEKRHIFASWDTDEFGIVVDETYKKEIEELYEAFKRKDVIITIGNREVFKKGGLLLIVKSAMSVKEVLDYLDKDTDMDNLKKAASKTRIEEILMKAGKEYFDLSPKWLDVTKTDVVFWLNPKEQNKYKYGWYTVEELKLWVKDMGPVLIKN